ncbi:MAG TPA: glycosyltransferase family 4 protein [Pyrinomonadaceae bacterium]|nr:glycosyltransferase family 4 protein [Pyrinomonadaceae bacterium]
MSRARIAVVVSGFPRLSETFAVNELLALAERDALVAIFATKPGDGTHAQLGLSEFLTVLPSDTADRQAAVVAQSLRARNVNAVHGYFAHQPAEVAWLAAERLRLPSGFSVHAKDARKISGSELGIRAKRAACVVACNNDVATTIQKTGARVHLIPHGVDLERFKASPLPPIGTFQILAVGRLVEKKGFHFLIEAVSRLKFPFQLRIIGEGPERERLAQMISAYHLSDEVTLCGPRAHNQLPEEYARAHVVAIPSIVDNAGDRDGLPNVVLEAMACGRAVVACKAGAIDAAVRDNETGLLLPAGDPLSLALALTRLAEDLPLRARLAVTAREHVEQHYEMKACSERFWHLLEEVYA